MGYLDLFTQQNDGTRVATPQIVDSYTFPQEIIEFSKLYPELPMDQVAQKYYEYQSKKQHLDQEKDKTPYDKQQSTIKQRQAEVQEKEIEKSQNAQKALKEADGMMKFISPSNYVELFSGKNLNAGQEFVADILLDPTSYTSFGLIPFVKHAGKRLPLKAIPLLTLPYNKINNKVYKETLQSQYHNFLKTINGDNYYRLAPSHKINYKITDPEEKLFVSHTTPWEEFSNSDYALLEFPTKTFGSRKATNYKGTPGDIDVEKMGEMHLNYGRFSSGKRGEVPLNDLQRLNQDYAIKINNLESIYDNVIDRPLKNGYYDHLPIYEDFHFGNQTTITAKEYNDALHKTNYTKYELTPYGIQKTLIINQR